MKITKRQLQRIIREVIETMQNAPALTAADLDAIYREAYEHEIHSDDSRMYAKDRAYNDIYQGVLRAVSSLHIDWPVDGHGEFFVTLADTVKQYGAQWFTGRPVAVPQKVKNNILDLANAELQRHLESV